MRYICDEKKMKIGNSIEIKFKNHVLISFVFQLSNKMYTVRFR